MEVYLNRRGLREEEWGEEKQRQLSRKERRELAKAIKSVEKKSQVILGEIYSPPRIALHLQKKGYQVGSSFDLQTGWDLSQDNHRRQMWRILREERPEVLVVSPPCTVFSRLQAINWGRMTPGHQVRLLQTGREHLQLAVAVMKWLDESQTSDLDELPAGRIRVCVPGPEIEEKKTWSRSGRYEFNHQSQVGWTWGSDHPGRGQSMGRHDVGTMEGSQRAMQCQELIEEFKRGSPITGEELPPGEGAELDEPGSPRTPGRCPIRARRGRTGLRPNFTGGN